MSAVVRTYAGAPLATLAVATGHHLPVELAHRVKRLRAERFVLAGAELPAAA